MLLNGAQAETGRWVAENDRIELVDLELNPPKTYEHPLKVVYEDAHLAVVVKPAGIVVSGNQFQTLQNMLPYSVKISTEVDALKWPRPVHRLDKATSGLVLVANTRQAHMGLGKLFEKGLIHKTYVAVVAGETEQSGRITSKINGQEADTSFTTLRRVPSLNHLFLSLVQLHPKTGRTHQLRIHMAGNGHPISGDTAYGQPGSVMLHHGLFLAAVGLSFKHPCMAQMVNVNIDIPHKFVSYLNREERRWHKYNSPA